jgi:hypothetical protein
LIDSKVQWSSWNYSSWIWVQYADRNCKENLRFDICKVMEKQCIGM